MASGVEDIGYCQGMNFIAGSLQGRPQRHDVHPKIPIRV